MGRRWTDQDIEDLKRMAQYYSALKIAVLTNRTAGGVVSKAYQLRLSLRSSRHANEQAIVADPAGIEQADLGGEATDHREWNPLDLSSIGYTRPLNGLPIFPVSPGNFATSDSLSIEQWRRTCGGKHARSYLSRRLDRCDSGDSVLLRPSLAPWRCRWKR
jgi:hypothetical protein